MDETTTDPTEEIQEDTTSDTEDGEETSDSEEETAEVDTDATPVQGAYMVYPGGLVQERYMTQ